MSILNSKVEVIEDSAASSMPKDAVVAGVAKPLVEVAMLHLSHTAETGSPGIPAAEIAVSLLPRREHSAATELGEQYVPGSGPAAVEVDCDAALESGVVASRVGQAAEFDGAASSESKNAAESGVAKRLAKVVNLQSSHIAETGSPSKPAAEIEVSLLPRSELSAVAELGERYVPRSGPVAVMVDSDANPGAEGVASRLGQAAEFGTSKPAAKIAISQEIGQIPHGDSGRRSLLETRVVEAVYLPASSWEKSAGGGIADRELVPSHGVKEQGDVSGTSWSAPSINVDGAMGGQSGPEVVAVPPEKADMYRAWQAGGDILLSVSAAQRVFEPPQPLQM